MELTQVDMAHVGIASAPPKFNSNKVESNRRMNISQESLSRFHCRQISAATAGRSMEAYLKPISEYGRSNQNESYKGTILEQQYDQRSELEIEKNRSQVLRRA